jgi:hypothetical protein
MYKVLVIVDPNFGDRLAAIPPGVPAWIVDTPENTPIVHRLWKERPNDTHLSGITTFRIDPKNSPEDNLIQEMDVIDLHHGPLSTDRPYMQIEVFGTKITDAIRHAFAEYGFDEFKETPDGFEAMRQRIPPSKD